MKVLKVATIATFVIAALAVAVAPLFLGDGYDPLRNSISESAAQGVPSAWVGRLALFASGLGVLLTLALKIRSWSRTASASFAAFGFLWIASSIFSTRSWVPGAAFNSVESSVHSLAASAMAIVVLGALVLAFTKQSVFRIERVLAFGLASAATFLPLASLFAPEFGGIFQRLMFFYAYFWFARQAALA